MKFVLTVQCLVVVPLKINLIVPLDLDLHFRQDQHAQAGLPGSGGGGGRRDLRG